MTFFFYLFYKMNKFDLQRNLFGRRAILRSAVAFCCFASLPQAHAQVAVSIGINRIARFRALSQRIAKTYCQMHLKVLPAQSSASLASARKKVQLGFDDLAKGQWPEAVAQHIRQVRMLSDALDALLVQPPTRESVMAVAAQADKMMLAADAATVALEKHAKVGAAQLVSTAGRQRMLSQRMAKNYSLAAAGWDSTEVRGKMVSDAGEFKQGMAALAAAPLSTPGIRDELALGESQWVFFEAALQRKSDARGLETVATTSERLLEVMDRLTDLYDNALKDALG